MFGSNPDKEEEKEPLPVPFKVFVGSEISGLGFVDQTTPLAVIGDPPSEVILPPLFAADEVMALTGRVVMEGSEGAVTVLKDSSFPYPVPALFVANARM